MAGNRSHLEKSADTEQPEKLFRILRVGGRRRAFSLEPIFWTVLEEAARCAGARLSDYLTELLRDTPQANATALLRTRAVEWLNGERERLRRVDPERVAAGVTQAIPLASFVIDERKRIIAYNRPFIELARDRSNSAPPSVGPVHLHLTLPLTRVVEHLREPANRSISLDFVLDFGGLRRPGSMNATLLSSTEDGSHLLCVVRQIGTMP
jgi:predicted DNA-binding ribbon-helix-helix protein